MGVLASDAGKAIGWCACGPRSRYIAATSPRSEIMRNRAPAEDETVWLLPCVFVRAGHRGQGVSHALVSAAVALARREGAAAIEGWPLADTVQRSADAFVGREQMFADPGFRCVDRPTAERVIMRLALSAQTRHDEGGLGEAERLPAGVSGQPKGWKLPDPHDHWPPYRPFASRAPALAERVPRLPAPAPRGFARVLNRPRPALGRGQLRRAR